MIEQETKCEEYLRKHRIVELFEDLTTVLAYRRPSNVLDFLVDELKKLKENGRNNGVFTNRELENIFKLYDLDNKGKIEASQAKKAIKTLASNEWQDSKVEELVLEGQIDFFKFKEVCETFYLVNTSDYTI